MFRLVIPGRLDGLNEFIEAQRTNKYKGAELKKTNQRIVELAIRRQLRVAIDKPVRLHYTWYERNAKRDLDNVSGFGHKVIQDALVACGVITDDSPKYVKGYTDEFKVDRNNPRIVVEIEEL